MEQYNRLRTSKRISHFLFLLSGKLGEICVEARTNYNRALRGRQITPWRPISILLNEVRVQNAGLDMQLGRRTPYEYVKWCRKSIRDALAFARKGRVLRAHLRKQAQRDARAQERAQQGEEEDEDEDEIVSTSEDESE